MNKKTTTTLAILTALCAAPLIGSAQPNAQGQGRPGKQHFAQLDTDGNGSVSQAELQASMAKRIAKLDTNGDGRVTKAEADAFRASKQAEMQSKHAERAQARFAKQDKNGDGKLSKDELPRLRGDWFERLDLNGDGYVTPDEMQEARETMKDRNKGRFGGKGHDLFGKLDADKNGVIDQQEIATAAKARFEKLDTDKNGALSQQELRAGFGHHGRRGFHGHCEGKPGPDES